MKYIVGKKEINIPEKEIEKLVNSLDISEDEAIQTWLFDNDYIENEEEAVLTKKAKDNRITATIHEAKDITKTRAKRNVERKEDVDKEMIIAAVANMLQGMGIKGKVTNKSKIVEFEYNGNEYKIDLIRRRKKECC